METEMRIERWNAGVVMCHLSLVLGLVGIFLYYVIGPNDYVWLSVLGATLGGFGVLIGGPVKTVETKVVRLAPVGGAFPSQKGVDHG